MIPVGFEDKNKCDNSVVAPVESGSTASRAYAKGEHFIRDGAFCTAKTAIAQGATFTLNTNYTAGQVSDFGKSGWSAVTTIASYAYGTLQGKVNKTLGIAIVKWDGNSTNPPVPSGSSALAVEISLTDFPDFVPAMNAVVPVRQGDSMQVRTDNKINLRLTSQTYSGASIMYPTA